MTDKNDGVVFGPVYKVSDLERIKARKVAAARILLGRGTKEDWELFEEPKDDTHMHM